VGQRLPSTPPVLPGLSYVAPLGSGGFADVFLYQQDLPRRQVAIKVLLADVSDPEMRRMFNAEADILARLSSHPSILTVYEASISADGRPYIAMEYCPVAPGARFRQEKLPVVTVLDIGVRVACALESAHRIGVLHRDVKPSNILVTEFGSPVLADFGIAASINQANLGSEVALSIPWSAPEVIANGAAGSVASEVWSLGATVYSLLAGRSPFERPGSTGQNTGEQLMRRIAKAAYTPTGRPDVPQELEQVLAATMARDPKNRYHSALEVAQALQAVQVKLGLAPTALDVGNAAWATPTQLVLDDDNLRGVIRPKVAQKSNRKADRRVASGVGPTTTSAQAAAAQNRAKRRWVWAVVGITTGLLAIVGAVVALALTGVI